MLRLCGCLLLLVAAASCAGPPKGDPRYPPQPAGCPVKIFRGPVPSMIAHDGIGQVDAICGDRIPESDCMRELMDQACKLGGDILYDVMMTPDRPAPDKLKYVGRVSHTRIAKQPAAGP